MFSYGISSYMQSSFGMPIFYRPSYQMSSLTLGSSNSVFGTSTPSYTQIDIAPKSEQSDTDIQTETHSDIKYESLAGVLGNTLNYFNNFRFTQILPKPTLTFKSNPISTTTTSTTTFNTTPKYTGTNATVQRALELAYGELKLGVKEDNKSNDSKEIRKYKHGVKNHDEWCGYFVSWLYEAGQNRSNKDTFGYQMNSQAMRKKAENAGFYAKKNSGYTPKPGDIMVIKKSDYKGHVGIVTKVYADGSFDTIEGNAGGNGGRVKKNTRNTIGRKNLDGFIRMEDWLNAKA